MRTKLRRVADVYFGRWYLPASVMLLVGLVLVLVGNWHWWPVHKLTTALWYLLVGCVLCMFAAFVVNLAARRWLSGVANLVLIPVVGFVILAAGLFASSGGDRFADNLTIPHEIDIELPKEMHEDLHRFEPPTLSPKDHFQCRLMGALKTSPGGDPTVTADIRSLLILQRKHPRLLMRYLACSPCWRVFEERGKRFATRRWLVGPHWHYTLHGYYYGEGFQTRTTIGLSGKPWVRRLGGFTRLKPGQTGRLKLSRISSHSTHDESWCLIEADGLTLEIFEESRGRERRLTKAALAFLEDESRQLVDSPKWATIQGLLSGIQSPPEKPALILWNSFQPGIYDVEIWANPGEPGMVYLRAYEVTHSTPLSEADLRQYSNEWVGWSDDPNELFLSSTHVTIHEGDWGQPYAARFEVWFVPDSGKRERKLMDKVFKIEGWQR